MLSGDHSSYFIPRHANHPVPILCTTDRYTCSETVDRTSSPPRKSASSEPEALALSSTNTSLVLESDTLSSSISTAWTQQITRDWLGQDHATCVHVGFRHQLARLLPKQTALKVKIAKRVARQANPRIRFDAVVGDVTEPAVAEHLIDCDAIFLAADSMRARLVINAICHQHLIPTWQVGAKVQVNSATGEIDDIFSVVRQLVPGKTCLWCNQLVNPTRLAEEAAPAEQRAAQQYVDEVVAPSVITLNAVAAAHAVNDYLSATVGLGDSYQEDQGVNWTKHRPLDPRPAIEIPRQDPDCPECNGRTGLGQLQRLPVRYPVP